MTDPRPTPPERVPSDDLIAAWHKRTASMSEDNADRIPGDALAARLAELSHVERVLAAMEPRGELTVWSEDGGFNALLVRPIHEGNWEETSEVEERGPTPLAALAALAEHLEAGKGGGDE